jgi:integrase
MKVFYFTKDTISKLQVPQKGADYYQDYKEKGLSLYITSNGVVTFFIRKVVNGKNIRIKIGRFPEISVPQARDEAIQIKAQIANGKNPLDSNVSTHSGIKFRKIFEEYMIKHSQENKKSWKDDEREVNNYLGHWLDKDASSITKKDVEDLHQKMGTENGIYQANRVLAKISSIYNKAIEWGHKLENPIIGIKKFKETTRDRFLQKDEITALLKALKDEQNTIIRDYILISLLTGARKSNVCSMKWSQIDFYTKIWRIPESKNGETLNIPITDKVIEILKLRKQDNMVLGFENSEYVFPGNGATGHLVEPKKAWKNILNRAGIKDLRLHDLRRTFGSWQAITGTSMQIIGKSLGHKSSSATEIYARLSMDPVRESVEKVTKLIVDSEE